MVSSNLLCHIIVVAGSHFNRHQHSHATSCRHFHVGPQTQIPVEFPMPHPGQSQTGISHHLGPAHQPPAAALHPPLSHIPAPPFQDIPTPPFLPQALHQQYLIQQQILEAQHRRILPQPRYTHPDLLHNTRNREQTSKCTNELYFVHILQVY